jgi:hypothetical protein
MERNGTAFFFLFLGVSSGLSKFLFELSGVFTATKTHRDKSTINVSFSTISSEQPDDMRKCTQFLLANRSRPEPDHLAERGDVWRQNAGSMLTEL